MDHLVLPVGVGVDDRGGVVCLAEFCIVVQDADEQLLHAVAVDVREAVADILICLVAQGGQPEIADEPGLVIVDDAVGRIAYIAVVCPFLGNVLAEIVEDVLVELLRVSRLFFVERLELAAVFLGKGLRCGAGMAEDRAVKPEGLCRCQVIGCARHTARCCEFAFVIQNGQGLEGAAVVEGISAQLRNAVREGDVFQAGAAVEEADAPPAVGQERIGIAQLVHAVRDVDLLEGGAGVEQTLAELCCRCGEHDLAQVGAQAERRLTGRRRIRIKIRRVADADNALGDDDRFEGSAAEECLVLDHGQGLTLDRLREHDIRRDVTAAGDNCRMIREQLIGHAVDRDVAEAIDMVVILVNGSRLLVQLRCRNECAVLEDIGSHDLVVLDRHELAFLEVDEAVSPCCRKVHDLAVIVGVEPEDLAHVVAVPEVHGLAPHHTDCQLRDVVGIEIRDEIAGVGGVPVAVVLCPERADFFQVIRVQDAGCVLGAGIDPMAAGKTPVAADQVAVGLLRIDCPGRLHPGLKAGVCRRFGRCFRRLGRRFCRLGRRFGGLGHSFCRLSRRFCRVGGCFGRLPCHMQGKSADYDVAKVCLCAVFIHNAEHSRDLDPNRSIACSHGFQREGKCHLGHIRVEIALRAGKRIIRNARRASVGNRLIEFQSLRRTDLDTE